MSDTRKSNTCYYLLVIGDFTTDVNMVFWINFVAVIFSNLGSDIRSVTGMLLLLSLKPRINVPASIAGIVSLFEVNIIRFHLYSLMLTFYT